MQMFLKVDKHYLQIHLQWFQDHHLGRTAHPDRGCEDSGNHPRAHPDRPTPPFLKSSQFERQLAWDRGEPTSIEGVRSFRFSSNALETMRWVLSEARYGRATC